MAITLKRKEKKETEVVSVRVNKSAATDYKETMRMASLQGYDTSDISNDMIVNTTAQLKKALKEKAYEATAQNDSTNGRGDSAGSR